MLHLLLAFLAGAVLPIQNGINSSLRSSLGHPLWTSLVSFMVGTLSLLALIVVSRVPIPSVQQFVPWQWMGGALGVAYVTLSIVLAPRLGAATLIGLVIAGQLCASLVLDHFGWLGFPQHLVTAPRVLGVVLLGAGVWLIHRF